MPPKAKITKEKIIDTAIEIVRVAGIDSLNARGLATALGASTQPIFSSFSSMSEVRGAVISRANSIYDSFIDRELKSQAYPPYKAMGMGYIKFALAERELFRLLFMTARDESNMLEEENSFEKVVDKVMKFLALPKDAAEAFHFEMWSCVHGIAVMLATDFLVLDESTISSMISDVYQGLLLRNEEKCK